MTKKRTKKIDIPIDETLEAIISEPTRIELLLQDFISMQKAKEMASVGFSMSSIAAALEIPASQFIGWIRKGKDNEEHSPNLPEVKLWKHLAKAWAVAKGLSESKLAQVDPKFFLTRGPAKLLGNDWDDDASSGAQHKKESLDVGEDFITALKALRERGHDLNEIIDNGLMTIKVDRQEKPVDLLEKHGITHIAPALPGPLAKQTIALDEILKIQRTFDDQS